jgi:hypothetical protein
MGARMKGLSQDLFEEWGSGTAILSPRDLDHSGLLRISRALRQRGGTVLLDPQFYVPRADYHRLTSHYYWPNDYDTAGFANVGRQQMLQELVTLNRALETTHLIVPGERAEVVNDVWLESQKGLLGAARDETDQPLIATICLSAEAIRSADQIGLVMEWAEKTSVWGYYLVAERPDNSYLTDDPLWLAHCLDLAAGLRRLQAAVIVGYSNHQQLIMACAAASSIASGSYLNVRAFSPRKFRSVYGEGFKRRATWYYLPQALSEYKLPFLDIGVRLGIKDGLYPKPGSLHTVPLFAAVQPSASGWKEGNAFRHYLSVLREQAMSATRDSFDETVAAHRALLDTAEKTLQLLASKGVYAQARDFRQAIDANRAALVLLENTQGPLLRRGWADLVR